MRCQKCGAAIGDEGEFCWNCGAPMVPLAPTSARVPNHLVLAICTTVLCCMPFGIASIVYAAQVKAKLRGGDLVGARQSSAHARFWALWGIVFGIALVFVAYILTPLFRAPAE